MARQEYRILSCKAQEWISQTNWIQSVFQAVDTYTSQSPTF